LKVAFFQFASSPVHFFASLEILKKEADEKNQNYYYLWGSQTSYPGRMSVGFESLFKRTPTAVRRLVKIADQKVVQVNNMKFDVNWVDDLAKKLIRQVKSMNSISELKELRYLEITPGTALANEITNLTKDRDLDLQSNQTLIMKLIYSYLEVYSATKIRIQENDIEKVHVFNGRFLHERAVRDCAKNLHTEVLIFETTRDRYFQRLEGFHSRTDNQKYMLEHWKNSLGSDSNKFQVGSIYFEELRSKNNPFKVESTDKFNQTNDFFVFFSSSDDEAVGFWDEWREPLGNQLEVVRRLQNIFDLQNDFDLVIRLHPNLLNKGTSVISNWSTILPTKRSLVIGPAAKISSYGLLDNCVGVISYGSTLGLEAAFNLKPSLVLADSGYDLLGVVDKADSWDEVTKWLKMGHKIKSESLNLRRQNATIRGYYLATAGIPFKNSILKQTGWGSWDVVSFCEHKIHKSVMMHFYQKLISKIKFLKINKLVNRDK
jgi:hypothetical protein